MDVRILATVLCVAAFLTQPAWALDQEWEATAAAQWAFSTNVNTTGFGGLINTRYGLNHWLAWETLAVSYLYVPGARWTSAPNLIETEAARRFDLHRVDAQTGLTFRLPLRIQAYLPVIPRLSLTGGLRFDYRTEGFSETSNGQARRNLDAEVGVGAILSTTIGIDYALSDSFLIGANSSVVWGSGGDSRPGVYGGILMSYLFFVD